MSTPENTPKPGNGEPAATNVAEQPPAHEQRAPKPAPRGGRVSSGLALILAFVALLGSGYLWYTLIHQRPALVEMDLPAALADLERATGEMKAVIANAEERIRALGETQNTLRAAVDNIRAEVGRSETQITFSETEQLLLIANRRLQLARDVASALAALRAADRQLERLADPNLLPVRREIAREIGQLEALERTDLEGAALRIASLAERVDQLPLAPELRAPEEQVAAAPRTPDESANSLWRDLLSLVRIRHRDATPRPLLPPEQQYFARENLRLMLYGAQHALLQGHVATFQQNLNTTKRWLNEHYEQGSPAVAAMRQEIERLLATPVMQELPDIAASLEMLRKVAARQRES